LENVVSTAWNFMEKRRTAEVRWAFSCVKADILCAEELSCEGT
jgi:hypothetical protein